MALKLVRRGLSKGWLKSMQRSYCSVFCDVKLNKCRIVSIGQLHKYTPFVSCKRRISRGRVAEYDGLVDARYAKGSDLLEERELNKRQFIQLKREDALELLELYKKDKSDVSDRDLVHLAYSCVTFKDDAFTSKRFYLISDIVNDICKRVPNYSHSYINRILKLCTSFRFSGQDKLALLCFEELVSRGSGVITKHIGIVARALAKLKLVDTRKKLIFEKSIIACEHLDIFDLSQLAWALTCVNHFPPPVSEKLTTELRKNQLPNCSYKALTSWMWCSGMAMSTVPNDFVTELVDEIIKRPFYDQLCAMTAWSLGKRKQFHKPFYDTMSDMIVAGKSGEWSPRLTTTFLWYLVSTYFYDRDTMDRLADSVIPALDSFSEHDLALLVRSYGTLSHPSPQLMEEAAGALTTKVLVGRRSSGGRRNTSQPILTTVWSCLVGDVYPRDLIRHVMEVESLEHVVRIGNVYAASVLLQLDLALRLEKPELGLPSLPQRFTKKLVDICVSNSASTEVSSKFHCHVQEALVELLGSTRYFMTEAHTYSPYRIDFELIVNDRGEPAIPPEGTWNSVGVPHLSSNSLDTLIHTLDRKSTQSTTKSSTGAILPITGGDLGDQRVETMPVFVETEGSPLTVTDTAVNLASDWSPTPLPEGLHRVALEADGRYHYDQTSQHVLGKTLLKKRQLEALGWKMLSIPYSEWRLLDKNATTQQAQFIQEKLKNLKL